MAIDSEAGLAAPGNHRSSIEPEAIMMPAPASVMWTRFDLASVGYMAEEFILSGEARAFEQDGTEPATSFAGLKTKARAQYRTRLVVFRPIDMARNCGTCIVEWFNCREIVDTAPQWIRMHRHMIREGMIWVGVSAQRAGVEGEPGDDRRRHLTALDPVRYAGLHHPGDAYAFDIFSQASLLVTTGALSFPAPTCVLGTGSSQSARFLTTYVNLIDPWAGLFDGFLLSGRHRSAATLTGDPICGTRVPIREDIRVPVFVVQPETDPFGRMQSAEVRQDDTERFRLWEIASAAHGDSYMAKVGNIDDGLSGVEVLAAAYAVEPSTWLPLKKPMNASPAFHYAHQAALQHLARWATDGVLPPSEGLLRGSQDRGIERDEVGIALGGVRSPWADCPPKVYSGENGEAGEFECLFGSTSPLPAEMLARLYPGGLGEFLVRFELALQSSIDAGFMVADDREECLQLAQVLFPA